MAYSLVAVFEQRRVLYDLEMRKPLLLFLVTLSIASATFAACSDATVQSTSSGGGSSSGSGASSSSGASNSSSSSGGSSSGGGADASCTPYLPPVLDGGGPCGTIGFGAATVAFTQSDAGIGEGYDGGVLEPGIYDAVFAERGSTRGGSWRETFVVDGQGNYTSTRQLDTGSDAGVGQVNYRSGKFTTSGNEIVMQETCAVRGDAGVTLGMNTLPFDTQSDTCGTINFRYGITGIRATLKRRK